MNKYSAILLIITLVSVSCVKEEIQQTIVSRSEEIILAVDGQGIEADVLTKVTAVSSVPGSLYFAGTTGTSTQTSKWTSVSKSVSSGKINTGYYQTETPTAYNYYLSNQSMTFNASGCTISADGSSKDVIVGITKASTSINPSVAMTHIFGRTGAITASCSGYSISDLSVTIKSNSGAGYKGTYNIYTGTWSNVTALSSKILTSSSDLYLVPGSYTITASATRTKGDYSGTVSGSTSISLTAGKIHDIAISFTGDPAQPINISVSLAAWSTTTVSGTIAG